MNHEAALETFLSDVVNLNATRLVQLETRVASITAALRNDDVIGAMYLDDIRQGSWAHKTIIRPVGDDDEFDADVLLQLEPDPAWDTNPGRYLREVRAAFKRHATYADKVQKKNRCVRIDYANDCHVDIVPYLVLPAGRQVIVNYAEDKFEDTNPAGFTSWMKEKDELAGKHLREVIRLTKYLRDHKQTFHCPSVILTLLLGNAVEAYDRANRYGDIASAFVNVLTDLETWLSWHPTMPYLEDPSCPGTSFNHRWTEQQYQTFKICVGRYAAWARAAIAEPDDDLAVEKWRALFGESFKKPSIISGLLASVTKSSTPRAVERRAPHEQFIEERGLTLTPGHTARIDAQVVAQNGFRDGPLRKLGRVPKHRTIHFRLVTDAPQPYQVLWKVRNRGDEAERLGQLRGELIPGDVQHTETTLYAGRHYIEAYVVQGNRVVATDHHEVNIA